MDEPIDRIDVSHGFKIAIFPDFDPENPRTGWDNLGTMICFHKRYSLGDEHDVDSDDYGSWDEMRRALIKKYDACVILPLYLYDHSGLRMKVGSFHGLLPEGHAYFDSGQVGFILISKQKVREEFGAKRISPKLKARVEGYLQAEVETYDQYLSGQVYGFRIETPDGDYDGGCWGFYGYGDWEKNGLLEQALPEAEGMIEDWERSMVQEAIDNRLDEQRREAKAREEEEARERVLRVVECSEMILDRLDEHGSIDPIREEGPVNDLRDAIQDLRDGEV